MEQFTAELLVPAGQNEVWIDTDAATVEFTDGKILFILSRANGTHV